MNKVARYDDKLPTLSPGEEMFAQHARAYGLFFEREFRFHPVRKWRFDFAHVLLKVAVECEGGIFSGGRHTRGKGFVGDMEKYNTAAAMGWLVLRFSTEQIRKGEAIDHVRRVLAEKGATL